ncbi:MAG: hypothetical protein Q7R90_01510 [bacterium]|nr:hypothetical protein [bacterium]
MTPLPILWQRIFSQRIFVVAAVTATVSIAGGLLLYQGYSPLAQALSNSSGPVTSANSVYLSAAAASSSTPAADPVREVHIANTGLTLLRGARVLSVSGSTAVVGMTWGASEFTWVIQTSYGTKFFNAEGEKESITSIHAGDIVTVTGKIAQGGVKPFINADVVRKQ